MPKYSARVLASRLTCIWYVILQIQRDAAKKEYENLQYQQPYQRAVYSWTHLLELNRWHTDEYQAVIGDLTPEDLEVSLRMVFSFSSWLCIAPQGMTALNLGGQACLFVGRQHLRMFHQNLDVSHCYWLDALRVRYFQIL